MGCRFELVIAASAARFARAAGEAAIDEIEDAHRRLTRFERGSVVSRFNESGSSVLDGELLGLVLLAERVRSLSAGAFDIKTRGQGRVEIDPERGAVRSVDGATIDAGGIAKGHAIDLAMRHLDEPAIEGALLHGGTSSVAAVGHQPCGSAWKVRVPHPRRGPAVTIRLSAQLGSGDRGPRAMSVSGDDRQVAHIVDPRSGRPREGTRGIVCVGADEAVSAAACDAWSTALCVLGERPGAMPDSVLSAIPTDQGWRIEPSGHDASVIAID